MSTRDSTWSDLASDAKTTFPSFGTIPGVDDRFDLGKAGLNNCLNDPTPTTRWLITGVPVPAPLQVESGPSPGVTIPAALNSGVFREPGLRQRPSGRAHPPPLPQCRL